MKFDQKTFKYFDLAAKEGKDRAWYLKNEELYLNHVKKPMVSLVSDLWAEIDDDLPGIEISTKKILRPVKAPQKVIPGENAVKNYINVNFSEKETSRFEWNPGIYLQLSSEKDENYLGVGLYMVSSRQLKLLREGFAQDYNKIRNILNNKKIKSSWGEVKGEKYSRFPKLYNMEQDGAEYIWFKQFYLSKTYTRKEVMADAFSKQVVKDIKAAVPFLQWLREKVGTYKSITNSHSNQLNDW